MIAFPSLPDSKGIPQLTQNRQFQWNHSPSTFIYPIIPAIAATLLKENDFDIEFYDGITRGLFLTKEKLKLLPFEEVEESVNG